MERLKNFWKTFFCGDRRKMFVKTLIFFVFGDRLKDFCEDFFFFFGEHLRLCPWSLALASSIPALGLESVYPRKGCPWPRIFFVSLALASSLLSSTPPLLFSRCKFLLARSNYHQRWSPRGLLGLEDTFSSPWPWPRSLKSSKIALSSARGQHYFLNS